MGGLQIRGLKASEELRGKDLIRDTRPLWQKGISAFDSQKSCASGIFVSLVLCFYFPAACYVWFFIGIGLFLFRFARTRKDTLPLRLPSKAGKTDYNDPAPGRKQFLKSGGNLFLGNEKITSNELWLKCRDILTHMLILGTTGSGKTEALVSMAYNILCIGSGFSYVDPKAAPRLAAQIYSMARFFGREDDFRIMNYLVAGKPSQARHPKRISNTHNPFAFGSAESLTQLIVSLIPKAEGNNAVFGQNAQTLINSLMFALKELADMGKIDLGVKAIRHHMTLKKYIELTRRTDLSSGTVSALKSFLTSVGWQEGLPLERQPRSLAEQYGYARSYFGLALASLTDTYGHIYSTNSGEIDMIDIIKNRRILLTLMSPLEKSPQEISNLGNITLSSVKNASCTGLGDKIEGRFDDVLESLPMSSSTPFVSFTDEYAAITTPGYAEVLTQGRGLGIAAVVASQDYPGLKKADEIGASQIIANTKMKWFMKTLDPQTFELAGKIASTAEVMQTSGYQALTQGGIFSSYQDQRTANVIQQDRVNFRDLQEQIEGEFHALFEGRVIRADAFHADIPLAAHQQVRINQMIPVPREKKTKLLHRKRLAAHTANKMARQIEHQEDIKLMPSENIKGLAKGFNQNATSNRSRNQRAVKAFLQYQLHETKLKNNSQADHLSCSISFLIDCMEDLKKRVQKENITWKS